MSTIKLSKQQWELIGKKAGWIKTAVINTLLQKGWAKKLPDGRYIRTYWPKDVFEREIIRNQEFKQWLVNGNVQQQPNGDYKLVRDPEVSTISDANKSMPKLSSKK